MAAEAAIHPMARSNRCVDPQKIMVTKPDEEIGFSHRVRHRVLVCVLTLG